jgi:hypothetical protein
LARISAPIKNTPALHRHFLQGRNRKARRVGKIKTKKMGKVLVIADFKGATQQQYDDSLRDLTTAGQLKLKERPHHFAALKEDGMYIIDIWDSAEDFSKFGEIMVPIIIKNGITPPQVQILPLHNELD